MHRDCGLKVSVIIPAYNAKIFVGRAIQSVQKQTDQDFEIIIIDDASQDNTVQVINSYVAQDSRIKLIQRTENGGPSAARNSGLEKAKGKWVAILDADDIFKPKRLESLIQEAEGNSLDMIADGIINYDQHAGSEVEILPRNTDEKLLPINLEMHLASSAHKRSLSRSTGSLSGNAALFKYIVRREFLIDNNIKYPEHIRYAEDFFFQAECFIAGARAAITPLNFYVYTQPCGSISQEKSTMSRSPIWGGAIADTAQELLDKHRGKLSQKEQYLLECRVKEGKSLYRCEKIKEGLRSKNIRVVVSNLLVPSVWPHIFDNFFRYLSRCIVSRAYARSSR